jgi:putative inorganic carbon (HCO3(-)) transporter
MIKRSQLLAGIAAGVVAGIALTLLSDATTKRALLAGVALLALIVLAVSRHREKICLAATIFLIPLNINYFLFGLYALHIGGATGLYLVPLDFPLAFLYANWILDKAMGTDRSAHRRSPRIMRFFLPFLTIAAVSVLYSINSAWASYELLRWVRFALLTFYFGSRIQPADLPLCFKALAATAVFQGGLALAQTIFRSNFGMDRLGVMGKGSENVFVEELASAGTMVRGAGTTGHPNILAPFLVLTVSIFFLFAITEKRALAKALWLGAGAIILSGLVATLSRSSWVSFAIACALSLVLAVVWRLLTVQRALLITLAGVLLAGASVAPFLGKLQERWKVGFTEAIEFRKDLNATAFRMISDYPLGGVGLNNFTIAYPRYDPERARLLEEEWGTLPVVHNLYLLVWSELGTLGLLALVGFWVAVYRYCLRLLRELSPSGRAFVIGSLAGILGLLFSDLTSFAFWTEVVMYTSAVLFGLIEVIRVRDTETAIAS